MPTNEVEQVVCDGCAAVSLSILQLDHPVPPGGWGPLFEELNIRTVTDFVGRPAIAAAAARRLLTRLAQQKERQAEEARRWAEEMDRRQRPPRGIPLPVGAAPDISALEVMRGHNQERTKK